MEIPKGRLMKGRGGSYKFQRLRERLRQAVLAGDFQGKLPGERELARRFEVNAKTISKALTDLTTEGLLIRQVGRGTFVAGQIDQRYPAGRSQRFHWLARSGDTNGRSEVIFDMVAARLRRHGHELIPHVLETDQSGRLTCDWATPGQLREVDGVIIHASRPSEELIADLMRRRIPLVLADCASDRITCNAVFPDYARAAFELTESLVWSGYPRVALATSHAHPCAAREARRGYHAALARNGVFEHLVIEDDEAHLAAALMKSPAPQAIVAFHREGRAQVRQALGADEPHRLPVLATVMAPGELIPSEVGEIFYGFEKEPLADWTVRLLHEASPGHQARFVLLPGLLHDPVPPVAQTAPGPRSLPPALTEL